MGYFYFEIWKAGRWINIGKCQSTREAVETQLTKDLGSTRRWTIASNGLVQIY